MAQIDIIQLKKQDGTKFYPAIARQPIVINGVFWLYNPVMQSYQPSSLRAGEEHNLFALTSSPQTIFHYMGTKPHVTVIGLDNGEYHEVLADVEYVDNDSVTISWNGDSAAYAYIG